MLYAGRIAVEKSVDKFLALAVPGTKIVVGDGPQRAELEAAHPEAKFMGMLEGELLAAAYRSADVFVFPSATDTFGLVMIEALACATPVAAFPVGGPRDVLTAATGAMADDLATAVCEALSKSREACARHGARFAWSAATVQFLAALAPIGSARAGWMLERPVLKAA
jgi:glycosyltransferase involved in cell wall biosynthesis